MKLELLAPAKNASVARQAILHGADAIYIGGPSHGARAAVSNSIADIAEVTKFAHQYGARVYVTLNTIVYDHEIAAVESIVWQLWQIGVDALIVQDMALLRMHLPPIALHASTQCDIRTPQKAEFLAKCGFGQLVLPRELSAHEIRQMREAVPADVALEAFVHGALCVSYSGDCQASCVANGRSANRGECAQMCRMAYDLVDANGNVLAKDKHLLSLRDLCRVEDIETMADCGISSFKIEGRLKDEDYVKNAVLAYRKAIDDLIRRFPDKYQRSSWGTVQATFAPDLNKAFNRGYTPYFLHGVQRQSMGMVNFNSPKWIGECVGTVIAQKGNNIVANLSSQLNNGDGMGFFNSKDQFEGFRLNKIQGNILYPASTISVPAGAKIYRNRDVKRDAELQGNTASRTIGVEFILSKCESRLCLEAKSESGSAVKVAIDCNFDVAKSPQAEPRKRTLSKLGDTIFRLTALTDTLSEDTFVAASALANLRREAISALTAAMAATYAYEYRRQEDLTAIWPEGASLTYHNNVANALARDFYLSHGVKDIEYALETQKGASHVGKKVMTTRYCLRREMGACLKDKNSAKQLPAELYIQNRAARYKLMFDCANCQMCLISQ